MMKTVVVDDEKNGRELLVHMLKKYCEKIKVSGSADDVHSAVELIDEIKPDLVFLDIEMPGGNGFEVLEKVSYKNFMVIFVTGYDHYAIKAIKYSAMDYLLKPVDLQELQMAVERALTMRQNSELVSPRQIGDLEYENEIIIQDKFKKNIVFPQRILYLESEGNYTIFHLEDSECIMATRNLNYYAHLLKEIGFFRVHRSFVVNLSKVRGIDSGRSGQIELINGIRLPLAVRRRSNFIKILERKDGGS